ncbi:MAG: hypothetical protein AAB673_03225 [Patescibacteria group bacterium]
MKRPCLDSTKLDPAAFLGTIVGSTPRHKDERIIQDFTDKELLKAAGVDKTSNLCYTICETE